MNGRSPSITDRILEYEQSIPQHRAGTVEVPVLQALERLVQAPLDFTVETGCGKSTILLSNLSRAHVVFAVDDSSEERSSIAYFKGCPVFRADRTRLVYSARHRPPCRRSSSRRLSTWRFSMDLTAIRFLSSSTHSSTRT